MSRPEPRRASDPARRERSRKALLWLVLFVQLAIPSSFYLGRDDPDDERFAWRMFSTQRFRTCQVQVYAQDGEGKRALTLSHELHASWIGALRRGRRRVIERFLASRCGWEGREEPWLERTCLEVDGTALPRQRFDYDCREERLIEPEDRQL